jgi:5-methylcytosine-specific restriction endonuclease McrA
MTGWTDGRTHAFIMAVLRAGTRRWPPKYRTLANAKTEKKVNVTSGRLAQHYECNACKQEFTSKNVEVDHREPVVDPLVGFTTWDEVIARLFCGEDNLQVLCKPCHKLKSKQESKERKRK